MSKKTFALEIDEEMLEQLKTVAKAERRSVKRQIVVLLRDFLAEHSEEEIRRMAEEVMSLEL